MSPRDFGKTVVVANPVARAGRAMAAIGRIEAVLRESLGDSLSVVFTEYAGHAEKIAQNLPRDVGTVIAFGGDGVVHEIANGLMLLPKSQRPALGVIPFGSGNDYAASLGMSMKAGAAARQIVEGRRVAVDVGCVNGVFFVETLSFGLDAAIAHATVDLRRRTGKTGTLLYAQAGIDQLLNNLHAMRYHAVLASPNAQSDDGASEEVTLDGEAFMVAIQLGPTYGGHFKICPFAKIDDGLFDICLAHPPLSALSALGLFGLAKNGWHVGSKKIENHLAEGVSIEFEVPPAAQVDGERLEGKAFRVSIEKNALTVIRAK